MCGIAGIVGAGDPAAALRCMVEAMRHRGPDDSGAEILATPSGTVALGTTRLAITDLSPAGHMPMTDPATGNRISYNGEVYNFQELRRELEAGGDRFRSGTDTEVILRAYARWGADCLSRFRGMFAFAIWDQGKQEVFLARDRIGKKPLYYGADAAGRFVFASELRTLLASGLIHRRLDPRALEVYLFNGFMVSPLTMIDGVRSLMPGHWMRVNAAGRILETRRYWEFPQAGKPGTMADMTADIRVRLEEAVSRRLISDVPLGAFLSGGLDSSSIVALMARTGGDVRTFSVTFDEAAFDESDFSNWVSRRFHTAHTEVRLRRDDFMVRLPDALAAMDQPTFDGLNTYYVSRAARESGLTVALTGAGGDELFGGYSFFREVPWLFNVARVSRFAPSWMGRAARAWIRRTGPKVAGPLKSLELFGPELAMHPGLDLLAAYQTVQMQFPSWVRKALRAEGLDGKAEEVWFGLPREFLSHVSALGDGRERLEQVSIASLGLFLAERCLRDIDSMSMGVSLEVRAPFTDDRLVEAVAQVPGRVRCAGAPDKPFEWALTRPYLGDDFPYRRKQGFIFPFEIWLRTPAFLDQMRAVLLDEGLSRSIGLRAEAVRGIADAFARENSRVPWSRMWSLYALFQWCQRHRVGL